MGKDTPAERNKKKAQGRANRLKSKLEDKNRQQYIEKLRSDRAGDRDDISGRSKTWTTGVKERSSRPRRGSSSACCYSSPW